MDEGTQANPKEMATKDGSTLNFQKSEGYQDRADYSQQGRTSEVQIRVRDKERKTLQIKVEISHKNQNYDIFFRIYEGLLL